MMKSSMLNNIKWYNLFECIENYNLDFKLILIDFQRIISSDILELEKQSILIEGYERFITFKEIQTFNYHNTPEFIEDLETLNIPYFIEENKVIVNGYQ